MSRPRQARAALWVALNFAAGIACGFFAVHYSTAVLSISTVLLGLGLLGMALMGLSAGRRWQIVPAIGSAFGYAGIVMAFGLDALLNSDPAVQYGGGRLWALPVLVGGLTVLIVGFLLAARATRRAASSTRPLEQATAG